MRGRLKHRRRDGLNTSDDYIGIFDPVLDFMGLRARVFSDCVRKIKVWHRAVDGFENDDVVLVTARSELGASVGGHGRYLGIVESESFRCAT